MGVGKRQRLRKKFRYSVSRKRLRNRSNKLPSIPIKVVNNAWQKTASIKSNYQRMGIACDPNGDVARKKRLVKKVNENATNEQRPVPRQAQNVPHRTTVADMLLQEAKEPRLHLFRFPKSRSNWFDYLVGKYGDNYKQMAADPSNHWQETWKQLRSQIMRYQETLTRQ